MNNYEKYADIIELPHHRSAKRPHMSLENRAAQFSPFAALTGYEDAVKETARLTDARIELEEYDKAILDRQLHQIREQLQQNAGKWAGALDNTVEQQLVITYFVPDIYKSGGAYETIVGVVRKLKEYEQLLVMSDGTEIPIQEILKIEFPQL